jgi:hypothetical protein
VLYCLEEKDGLNLQSCIVFCESQKIKDSIGREKIAQSPPHLEYQPGTLIGIKNVATLAV